MKIAIGLLLFLCFLSEEGYSQCTSTKKLYYALVEGFPIREVPHFQRAIVPKHLHFFRIYYILFLCNGRFTKFEIYQDRKRVAIVSRNPDYTEYKRLNEKEDTIFLQHLYYDDRKRLIRQENYHALNPQNRLQLFTFYTYFYQGSEPYPRYLEIFDSQGNPIQGIDTSIWGREGIPLKRKK